jgi:hypothetical protein
MLLLLLVPLMLLTFPVGVLLVLPPAPVADTISTASTSPAPHHRDA